MCVRLAALAMETDFILRDNKYKACLNGNIVPKSVHNVKKCIKDVDEYVKEILKRLIMM